MLLIYCIKGGHAEENFDGFLNDEFTRLIYVTISIVDNELFTSSSWRFPPSLMEHVRLSQFSGIECLNFNFLSKIFSFSLIVTENTTKPRSLTMKSRCGVFIDKSNVDRYKLTICYK